TGAAGPRRARSTTATTATTAASAAARITDARLIPPTLDRREHSGSPLTYASPRSAGIEGEAADGDPGQDQGRAGRHHRVDGRLTVHARLALPPVPQRDKERCGAHRAGGPGGRLRIPRCARRPVRSGALRA